MRKVPFTRRLPIRLWRRRESMAADWDRRARTNAPFYVCTESRGSPAELAVSGERDLLTRVVDGLRVDRSWRALEIGCGIGRLLRPLSRLVAEAVGVDISEEMIQLARENCRDCPNVRLHVTEGDLPFLDAGSFDFVFSHIVFQHVPRKLYVKKYFAEAFRVLKRDGLLRVQVDGRSHQFFRRWIADSWSGVVFSSRELRRRLEREGFVVVEIVGAGSQYLRATARKP